MQLHSCSLFPLLSRLHVSWAQVIGGSHMQHVICVVEIYLISIPAKLPNVFQKLVGAHVRGVQTGLMLPDHLRGPGWGLPRHPIICKQSTPQLSKVFCVLQPSNHFQNTCNQTRLWVKT